MEYDADSIRAELVIESEGFRKIYLKQSIESAESDRDPFYDTDELNGIKPGLRNKQTRTAVVRQGSRDHHPSVSQYHSVSERHNEGVARTARPNHSISGVTLSETYKECTLRWPVIETEVLHTNLRLLQKAHQVLAWLVHFYIHSIPPSNRDASITVPKSIAVPLVAVSRVLGIAPVLTFADTVLWNCEPVDKSCPISLENIRPKYTFSDTDDERSFYIASARTEIRGIEILRIIDAFHSLPNMSDFTSISRVSRDLARLTKAIEDISEIIQSVRADCDPHVFYWEIRPCGPSAGQSTVIHALDIFLGIDHKLQYRRSPAPSPENKRADRGFMARMRRYMPGKHREFLEYLAAAPRQLRDQAQETTALKEPYDAAVMALKKLRDMHMRIACLYIVTMSRSAPSDRPGCPVLAAMERQRDGHQKKAQYGHWRD
ncbi:Indoleamine 2,3-dioxygenase [Salix suchowensis]|nr:Indoleamine 2,3-dioxygenase [Salix suchowensis]